jgi:hypothetical protein
MGSRPARRDDGIDSSRVARLLREPTLHFFLIAAAVLVGHRLVTGEARTIEITHAHKADLLRSYRDQLNRAPTNAEAEAFMAAWKADEALYREALREGLDRDDATVRAVLIGKMRERALLQARMPEPTQADLRNYLERHRDQFEAPLLYEHEWLAFPKAQAGAKAERDESLQKLEAGATPASLGLESTVANVNRERIEREFGSAVAEKVIRLPPLQWHSLETADRLLLVKLVRIQGGLPEPEVLHERLVAAWKGANQQKALAEATRRIAERYRFEEKSK